MGLIAQPSWAVTQWIATGVPTSSSESKSNFPAEVYSQWGILQTLLQNYRQGYFISFSNSTTLTIGSGEASAWNGTASLFLQNTGSQTATTTNLDTGSTFNASTTYYVYAGSSSITQATGTISISLNNTTPSNLTYYKRLGSFTTDGSSNILGSSIVNDNSSYNMNGNTISNGKLGTTSSGSLNTGHAGTTSYTVPTGCYVTGMQVDGANILSLIYYSCP
jgi:hypothetical protein